MNPGWLVPNWPVPPHVHALCTTRAGGVSLPPYDALNLGDHVGDNPVDVMANRAVFKQAIVAKPVFLPQVHGTHCERVSATTESDVAADGCVTNQAFVACTVMVADCLPVLFTNSQGTVVAAAHAGWRGLAGQNGVGILDTVYKQFAALEPVHNAQAAIKIVAWLGPCIGPQAFEVDDDVRDVFVRQDRATSAMFRPKHAGKWLADLPGLARLRLNALGVNAIYGNDGSLPWCTLSNPSRFFSHRRDAVSGRMAACIWLS